MLDDKDIQEMECSVVSEASRDGKEFYITITSEEKIFPELIVGLLEDWIEEYKHAISSGGDDREGLH